MYWLYLLIVVVVVVVVVIAIGIFQSRTQVEPFYTLFQPYYYPETITTYNFYVKNNKIPELEKSAFTLLISPEQLKYSNLHLFLKSLIAYYLSVAKINLISENSVDDRAIIRKLGKDEANMAIVPAPILADEYEKYPQLQYMASINDQYIFIIAGVNRNTDLLEDLHGKKIGVGHRGSLWEKCADDVFNFQYQKYHGSLRQMLEKLYNFELDAILITDTFPANTLNYIIYNFYDLHLISLHDETNRTFYYTKKTIDLNQIINPYLPQASFFEKYTKWVKARLFNATTSPMQDWYSHFNHPLKSWQTPYVADFITFRFSNYLICNPKNITPETGYTLTKHIFNNHYLLDKSINPFTFIPMEIEKGAKKFYYEKGYMSNNPSEDCKYLYGKDKCDDEELDKISRII